MITWQDWVIFLGGLVILAGLVPALWAKVKPPLSTTLPIACAVAAFGVVSWSLNLYLATAINAVQALLWLVLAAQWARHQHSAR